MILIKGEDFIFAFLSDEAHESGGDINLIRVKNVNEV